MSGAACTCSEAALGSVSSLSATIRSWISSVLLMRYLGLAELISGAGMVCRISYSPRAAARTELGVSSTICPTTYLCSMGHRLSGSRAVKPTNTLASGMHDRPIRLQGTRAHRRQSGCCLSKKLAAADRHTGHGAIIRPLCASVMPQTLRPIQGDRKKYMFSSSADWRLVSGEAVQASVTENPKLFLGTLVYHGAVPISGAYLE